MNKTTGRHTGFHSRYTGSSGNNRLNPFLFALFCVQSGFLLHMAFASHQQQPAPQPKITIGTSGNVYISQPEGNRALTIAPVAGGGNNE